MPANVTHMLIAHKALQKLKTKGIDEFAEFAGVLDDTSRNKNYKAYVNLGSLGPDLFYYADIGRSVKDILIDRFRQAKAITQWSYLLHSNEPNKLPLKLIKIIYRDAVKKEKVTDDSRVELIKKLAYIAGHLTHIAADQIIHPLVNGIAGPYYHSGENRFKHRESEVFQDYFLYEEVYRLEEKKGADYEFFEQKFHKWIDCVEGLSDAQEWLRYLMRRGLFLKWDFRTLLRYLRRTTFKSTEEWFRYFLQRGFAETYGIFPPESKIEDSVDHLRLTLWMSLRAGPYKTAAKDYNENGQASAMFREYVKNVEYIKYYRLAVELAVIYLIALYEVYFVLEQGEDFTQKQEDRFFSIVSNADLSCPLKQGILEKAYTALMDDKSMEAAVKTHIPGLLAKTKFLTTNRIFKTSSDRDIVKA